MDHDALNINLTTRNSTRIGPKDHYIALFRSITLFYGTNIPGYSPHSIRICRIFHGNCQSHITLLWIGIMLSTRTRIQMNKIVQLMSNLYCKRPPPHTQFLYPNMYGHPCELEQKGCTNFMPLNVHKPWPTKGMQLNAMPILSSVYTLHTI